MNVNGKDYTIYYGQSFLFENTNQLLTIQFSGLTHTQMFEQVVTTLA
jgi:hypothetical protein